MEPSPSEQQSAPGPMHRNKALHVVLAGVVGVAVVGYFAGVEQSPPGVEPVQAVGSGVVAVGADMEAAPGYGDLLGRREAQARRVDPLGDEVVGGALAPGPAREEAQARSLASRSRLRAYDGAPPTVPHPISQRGFAECMACHGSGLSFDGRTAPVMSHPYKANCAQCHALAESPLPASVAVVPGLSEGNTFVGLSPRPHGERAWLGAPPVIPHSTWMREDCRSCHGPHGRPGMRSTHLERSSCTQCHAPGEAGDHPPLHLSPFLSGSEGSRGP